MICPQFLYLQLPLRQRFACPHKDCKRSYCLQGKQNFHVKTALGMTGNTQNARIARKCLRHRLQNCVMKPMYIWGKRPFLSRICVKRYVRPKTSSSGICDLATNQTVFNAQHATRASIYAQQRGKCGKPIARCLIYIMKFLTLRNKQRHKTSQHTDHTSICEMCGQEFRFQCHKILKIG